nr:hypothetical protein [Tanacetum cinerariifolium]
ELQQLEQAAKLSAYSTKPSQHFNSFFYDEDDDDDDEKKTIPLRDIIFQLPSSIVITTSPPVLPTFKDPEDSLIIGSEDLSTILEKKSDKFIKSSVEDLDPIQVSSRIHQGVKVSVICPFVMIILLTMRV